MAVCHPLRPRHPSSPRLAAARATAWAGFALATVIAASPLAALDGRLLLPDGSPAAGFEVALVGRPGSVPTDAEGRFRLLPDPTMPALLLASEPNGRVWSPLTLDRLPAAGSVVELRLDPTFRDEVTVAAGVAMAVDAPPAAGTVVLGREDLEQRKPDHLYDTLAGVAGASKSGEGADSVPALRGLPKGRTLLLIDGARVTTERRAGASATFLDPFSLGSLDVARGPGSVVYGSDAFGGVLDARTRDPELSGHHLRYDLSQAFAASDLTSVGLETSLDLGAGALLAVVHGRDAGNYQDGTGAEIPVSFYSDRGGALRYLLPVGNGRLRLSLAAFRVRDLGKAALSTPINTSIYPEENADRLTAGWVAGPTLDFDEISADLFVGRYDLTLERTRQPNPTTTRRIDTSDTAATDASLRLQTGRALYGGRIGFGAELVSRFDLASSVTRTTFDRDDRPVGSSNPASIDDAAQRNVGLYATWLRPVGERFSLSAGLRGDQIDSRNRDGFVGDRKSSDSALSGHLAGTVQLAPGLSFTLQGARGFRVPTLSDRYFRGPSGRGSVTGNPDLGAEQSTQLDLALRYAAGKATLALYGYHYQIDDLIERYQGGDDFFFRNRGQAEIRGVELEGRLALPAGFTLELALANARGDARDAGGSSAPVDDIAAPGGTLTTRWAGARGYAYVRGNLFAEDDRPGPTELVRPSYTSFDLAGGWRFSEALELRLLVRNLFDRAYTEAADNDATAAPGRAVTVGISGRL